jgi:hypothetical protein
LSLNIITVTTTFLLDSDGDDDSGPNGSKTQLGMMSSICLDNVYMNYLQKKTVEKPKKKKKTKSSRLSKGRETSSSINAKDKDSRSPPNSPKHSQALAQQNNTNMSKNNDNLLLGLMQKNVKDGEFTPEQKSLHEAYDVLMAEYQRRKDQRQKVGGLFRKNKRNLKDILKSAMAKSQESGSDLALKARSQDLQRNKREERKKKRITSFAAIVDSDKI